MSEKQKAYTKVIENVVFAFVKIAESDKKYKSEDRDYSLNAIVSKAQYKEFKKEFPKQSAKEIDNDEFEQKFKMAPPFDTDEQYVLKISKAHTRNGKEMDERYRPKVYLRNEDGSLTNITTSRLIANGSKGSVAVRVTNNEFGQFAFLDSICVEEFIEYTKNDAGNPFGGKVVATEPENKSATEARKSVEKKAPAPEQDDENKVIKSSGGMGDDIPFAQLGLQNKLSIHWM